MPESRTARFAAYRYRTSDAADHLGVSAQCVVNWANSGRLPYLRTPGGHRRFRVEDLDDFAASLVQHATDRETAS